MLHLLTITSCSGAAVKRVSALEKQHPQPIQEDIYSDDQGKQWPTVQHILLRIKAANNAKQLLRRAQVFCT